MALGVDGEVLLGECKWGRVRRDDVARLEARAALVLPRLRDVRSVHLALFARGSIDTAVQPRIDSGEVLLFTPDDLYS